MKFKKNKQTRRHLRFFRAVFGYRPPYKVLLDGNYLHAIVAGAAADAAAPAELLERLLEGKIRPFLSSCIIAELKALGPEVAGAPKLGAALPLGASPAPARCPARALREPPPLAAASPHFPEAVSPCPPRSHLTQPPSGRQST